MYRNDYFMDQMPIIMGMVYGEYGRRRAEQAIEDERIYQEYWEKHPFFEDKPKRESNYISPENRARIKEISRDVEGNLKGIEAEEKIHSYLNPGPFARVPHYELHNVYLRDSRGMTHEIDFIEIRETGVFCIEVKNWSGEILGTRTDPYWYVHGEQRRNPTIQNDTHIRAMHDVIGKKPHITPVVVLAQNNAGRLNIDGVINLLNFRAFMSQFQEKVISPERMKEIRDAIENARVYITREEHVRNIRRFGK